MRALLGAVSLSLASMMVMAEGNAVTYTVNGQEYEGYYVSSSPDAPLVLLVHDWDGLTDYEIKRAEMLSDLGYDVFAADLFGAGVRPTELEDKRQHTGELYKDREKMRVLMNGALDAARAQGAQTDNVVAAGYCFGGAAVLELARSGAPMAGFATFHGGLSTPEGQNYSTAKGKVLIMHGSADAAISLNDFATLGAELETASVSHEMITYSGAPHGFTVFGADSYREEADKQSWKRFASFLDEQLGY
uniref:dienelactone hydrolase family protein n=1 Tax=Marinobacterium profundum TaxID=1714300 RepID=UPI00082E727F|nr:dienelactone hydrolase family protein [Marinobacterium profundum]